MRIKKLELVGFKSFKDRTVIHFDAGITGIVGPNGCGKSNIVDALVWVMGEMSAKHLRGSSMEDVIFAGAEGYAPTGMAEVSLTLENDGGPFPVQYLKHSEIMLTRRLHRNGESEYFVNKEPARLRDIQEVFMDTGAGSKGFSIVEQGQIGKIITAKPEDRRTLIEEAAGITKFKARKRESQRKLIATEQNLLRLHDIVGELKRQIDSLQRQAQRAERYRGLKREIEDLDLWLSSRQFLDLREITTSSETIYNESEAQLLHSQNESSSLEADLEVMRVQLATQEMGVQDKQNQSHELRADISKRESEVQELRFEIEQARRNKEMTGSLLQENETRKGILDTDIARVSESLSRVRTEAETLRAEYALKREMFETNSRRSAEIDDELTTSRRELLTVSQGESHISARMSAIEETIANIVEREQEAQAVLTELLEKRVEFEGRLKRVFTSLEKERQMQLDLAADSETLEANKKQIGSQMTERRLEVDLFKDSLNEVTSRLYGLENLQSNLEGFEAGVKSVMFWQRQKLENVPEHERERQAQFKPVSEVVEVPSEYELAMEAALGPRLQMLLADSSESVKGALGHLKSTNAGRSSFYPSSYIAESFSEGNSNADSSGGMFAGGGLQMMTQSGVTSSQATLSAKSFSTRLLSKLMTDEEMARQPGVEAVLVDRVEAPERFHESVRKLLDGIAVVRSLEDAIRLHAEAPGWSFVTKEGDLLSADGVVTGGTADSADSGVLKRRREIKELSLKKEEWAGKLALAQASLKKLEESYKNICDEVENAVRRATEKEIVIAGLKKDLERAETEFQNVNQAISRQEREVATIQSQIESRRHENEELNVRLTELRGRKGALESSIESLSQEHLIARSGIDELQARVTELQVQSATRTQECEGLERQLDMLRRSLMDVEIQLGRMSEESTKSAETMSTGQILLEEKKVQLESAIQKMEELNELVAKARDEFENLLARVRESERTVSGFLSARGELQNKMGSAKIQLEQAKLKEQYLMDQIRERYLLDLTAIADRYREREGDLSEAEKQLKELKDKISKIGDVNLAAIEEYDEVAKRYEFLSQQQNDLVEAKENLKKVIDRINRICSKRFKETFELVNERFTKVFPVLFGGGEARLILVEESEKGEMGIDIVAKPPGKKLQSVSLLSGGEKALTAVSLIFSIFLVKPSPYCLLDEVDAPLDDANVFRFNDLVREMAKRSQIIVVTHNKYTMEVASKLYGVTMQEKGVSKMVSVNLGEAQVAVAEA